jgi:hypothetical protein
MIFFYSSRHCNPVTPCDSDSFNIIPTTLNRGCVVYYIPNTTVSLDGEATERPSQPFPAVTCHGGLCSQRANRGRPVIGSLGGLAKWSWERGVTVTSGPSATSPNPVPSSSAQILLAIWVGDPSRTARVTSGFLHFS